MIRKTASILGLLLAIAIPAAAWASPQAAICVVSSLIGEEISRDGKVRASEAIDYASTTQLRGYVQKGRARIAESLWTISSDPNIIFLDGEKVLGIFDYNPYGSAVALPGKTCLLIGPKGASIDVVAHELAHADLAEMLGYWKINTLPAWINEGVAMQVDMRDRYHVEVLDGRDPRYVTTKEGRHFYTGETGEVVQNYAAAKHLFSGWIETNGIDKLLVTLRSNRPNSFIFSDG